MYSHVFCCQSTKHLLNFLEPEYYFLLVNNTLHSYFGVVLKKEVSVRVRASSCCLLLNPLFTTLRLRICWTKLLIVKLPYRFNWNFAQNWFKISSRKIDRPTVVSFFTVTKYFKMQITNARLINLSKYELFVWNILGADLITKVSLL